MDGHSGLRAPYFPFINILMNNAAKLKGNTLAAVLGTTGICQFFI
jgi:hypothetical protein